MAAVSRDVRNVVLVGHTGAGKTTLLHHLLRAAGATSDPESHAGPAGPGVGADGNGSGGAGVGAVRPGDAEQRSITLTLASVRHRGLTINLLDTPGYPDFVGELRAGLRAADAALFVVSAVDGIDGATRMLWSECAAVGMPRAIAITRLDHPTADFDLALAACQEAFGTGVLPVYLPDDTAHGSAGPAGSGTGGAPSRLIGLLTGRIISYHADGRREHTERADLVGAAADTRSALIEGIIAESEDEGLLDRYLGGEELEPKMLMDDLETAVARGSFYPVLPLAVPPMRAGAGGHDSQPGLGTVELLDLFVHAFPSPREHPLPELTRADGRPCPPAVGDPDGPLVAEVVRTTTDPYVGRLSVVRVFSGVLRPDAAVHVCGHGRAQAGHPDHDDDERIGALSSPVGTALRSVGACLAGGICVVTKLSTAETGDTLSDQGNPLYLPAWTMPEPLLPIAVQARARSDESKLSTALTRIAAEDPTLTIEQSAETGQLVLWCMGEAHCDVVLDRLEQRFGVTLDKVELRIPMCETLRGSGEGVGRLVKQSGGHGQYAICRIRVEPLPPGGGFEFVDEVVGGTVPRQFIPSVEKGVRAQMERGVLAGWQVTDIRVRLVDGKAHSVDSSDMAFQVAGGLALREAARTAGTQLLEPVLDVSVIVPDEYVGAVMSDLSGRRGRVVGIEPVGSAGGDVKAAAAPPRTHIHAEAPEVEMVRYAVDLRSLSHGTGVFSRRRLRFEAVPDHLTARLATPAE